MSMNGWWGKGIYIALLMTGMVCSSASASAQQVAIDLERDPPDQLTEGAPADPFFPWGAWAERVKTAEISPLSSGAFGEQVSLFDGRTGFSVTDIDIPGSDALPVRLGRTFAVTGKARAGGTMDDLGGVGDWTLDVPYIAGVFDYQYPWTWDASSESKNFRRCSSQFRPRMREPLAMSWSGNRVHLPGMGDRTLLYRDPGVPTPDAAGAYEHVTAELDAFTCIKPDEGAPASASNPEGFVMHSADGSKWTFNVEARRGAGSVDVVVSLPGDPVLIATYTRQEVYLLASKVEDRFGNKVEYNWVYRPDTVAYEPRLETIVGTSISGETRTIALQYEAIPSFGGIRGDTAPKHWRLKSASAYGRIWNYAYYPNSESEDRRGRLKSVTLPDQSAWTYETTGSLLYSYDLGRTICLPPLPTGGTFSLKATHPAGARAEFSFVNTRFFRDVAANCTGGDPQPPPAYDAFSLLEKSVTAAGLATPQIWDYAIEPGAPGGSLTRKTTVTQPDMSRIEYQHGNVYDDNEGRLLTTTTFSSAGTQLRQESLTYLPKLEPGTAFPTQWGISPGTADQTNARIQPILSRSTTENGVTFGRSSTKQDFDSLARVLSESQTGSAGQKTRMTTYSDNTGRWILGQVKTVKEIHAGITRSLTDNTYDPTNANLLESREFGRLVRSQIWNSDGTVKSQDDGAGNRTRFFNYKRGIPQNITFADPTIQMSAAVDDWGQITSMTDPVGGTTGYEYYPEGRLKKIFYPSAAGDPAWNATTMVYSRLQGSNVVNCPSSLPTCSHWQVTRTTGSAVQTTWLDGLWRPVLGKTEDTASSGTTSHIRRNFDHEGREIFASYPSSSAAASTGTHTQYDALGRVTAVSRDSELGQLTTISNYDLLSHKRTDIDAKSNVTETFFESFAQPSYDTPSQIHRKIPTKTDQVTAFARNGLGKVLTMTRSGGGHSASATRSYSYNSFEQLCTVSEPESGTRAFGYDAAGNLAWRGTSSAGNCNRRSASEITDYQYDVMNRLYSTTYPSGTAAITQGWYADGALESISQGGVNWTYTYNGRRLPKSETLSLDGKTFQFDWAYSLRRV